MIKTVIFDLGNVIVPFDFGRGYRAMAEHCPYSAEEIRGRLGATDLVHRFESGQVPARDFYNEVSGILHSTASYEKFCAIWNSVFFPVTLIPEAMLEGLKKRVRLLLLSNTNEIHFTMIRREYALMRHFDDFVLSHQVGAMKPSPRIYETAIAKSGCEPGECFFTDDIAQYVEAARAVGIDAVQFESAGQIEHELRTRGVDWG